MRHGRTALVFALLVVAGPLLVGGPRLACQLACHDDDDDGAPCDCAQACCSSTLATIIPARAITLLPRPIVTRFPPPSSDRLPPSPDPHQQLRIPKPTLA